MPWAGMRTLSHVAIETGTSSLPGGLYLSLRTYKQLDILVPRYQVMVGGMSLVHSLRVKKSELIPVSFGLRVRVKISV